MALLYRINRLIFVAVIVLLIFGQAECKKAHKKITIQQLSSAPQTVFLSKFGVSNVGANITIKYKKFGDYVPELKSLKAGILHAQKFYQHLNAESCQQKQQFYHQTYQLKFFDLIQGMKNIKLSKTKQQHLEFIFIFNCQYVETDQKSNSKSGLNFDVLMDNNGLGMEEYGIQLWPYTFMIVVAFGLCLKYWRGVLQQLENKKNMAMILIIAGFLLLAASVGFKFFSVMRMVFSGQSIAFFDALYITLKAIVQVIMATILTSIAWGWLLNNPRYKYHFIAIVCFVTVLNIIAQILADGNKQQITNQHLYQGKTGKLILLLRIINSVIFISGCLYVSFQSTQKRQSFINNFAQVGAIYLLANLISLLLSELFSHAYRHGEVVPMLQDVIRLALNTYLCYLFAFPKDQQGGYHEVGFGFQMQDQGFIEKQINQYPASPKQKQKQKTNHKAHHRYQGKSADLI